MLFQPLFMVCPFLGCMYLKHVCVCVFKVMFKVFTLKQRPKQGESPPITKLSRDQSYLNQTALLFPLDRLKYKKIQLSDYYQCQN